MPDAKPAKKNCGYIEFDLRFWLKPSQQLKHNTPVIAPCTARPTTNFTTSISVLTAAKRTVLANTHHTQKPHPTCAREMFNNYLPLLQFTPHDADNHT